MFIYAQISVETADKYNGDAADVVVYIPPNASQDFNTASLCIWMIPGTQVE